MWRPRGGYELFLLDAGVAGFLGGDEGVGDVAEGAEDGLLVVEDELVFLVLGELELAAELAAFEDGLGDGAGAVERGRGGWRSLAPAAPPSPVRESCGKNCARATPMLALAAMSWASACSMSGRRSRSCGGNAGGQVSGRRGECGGVGVRDGAGCLAEQEAELVFGLLDLLLELRDLGGCGVEELLGLADVREWSGAAGLEFLREIEGVLADFEGLLRDGELGVERAKLEVGGGDLLYEGDADGALGPLLREELIALGFGLFAVEAPEVGRPGGGKAELDGWAGEYGGYSGGDVGSRRRRVRR